MTETRQDKPARGIGSIMWRRYRKSSVAVVGLTFVAVLLILAVLAPALANEQPLLCKLDGEIHAPALVEVFWTIPGGRHLIKKDKPFNQATFKLARALKPERGDWAIYTPIPHGPTQTSSRTLQKPSDQHILGTDRSGRDVLSRMIHGARVSMTVGFASISVAATIGILIGALAGFFGGWVDIVISRFIEIVMSFPVIFLILGILAWVSKPSIWGVMLVLGLVGWTGIARFVRGEFMRLRSSDFALAATAIGAKPSRIIFKHILPNAIAPIFVPITFGIASAILTESSLSFLGFGVQPPAPSWGNILREGFEAIFTSPHMIYPPCVAIFIAVLAYNLVGDRLRDVVDPRLRGSR